jgi:thioesterase domain-containing protein
VYPGRLTLFRARQALGESVRRGVLLGWDGLAAGGIDVHRIPGTHDSLVLEPNVEHLLRELKACLREADPRCQPSANHAPESGARDAELSLVLA